MTLTIDQLDMLATRVRSSLDHLRSGGGGNMALPAFFTVIEETKQFAKLSTEYVSRSTKASAQTDQRHCEHWESVANSLHHLMQSLIEQGEAVTSSATRRALNHQATEIMHIADDLMCAVTEIVNRNIG